MFDQNSRYYGIETVTQIVSDSDGLPRELRYVKRRFLPNGANMTVLAEHTVQQNERLDNITARYLGDPTLFWRLCDVNNAMRPDELTEETGRILKIGLPGL